MRITDEHLAHWRRHGYVVVPSLLTEAELAAIQANVRRYFPTDEEYRAAPERYPDVGGWRELPFVGDALNDLATPPELVSFAQRLIRTKGSHWMGFSAWARSGGEPALQRFLERATPRQRELLGFPPPGHPYWNEETLAGVAARYPAMDMTPYRDALR